MTQSNFSQEYQVGLTFEKSMQFNVRRIEKTCVPPSAEEEKMHLTKFSLYLLQKNFHCNRSKEELIKDIFLKKYRTRTNNIILYGKRRNSFSLRSGTGLHSHHLSLHRKSLPFWPVEKKQDGSERHLLCWEPKYQFALFADSITAYKSS